MKKKLLLALCFVCCVCTLMACGKGTEPESKSETESEQEVQSNQTEGEYAEIYNNLVISLMESNIWNENPEYVYTQDELKKYFDEISEENKFYQLTISKGLVGLYTPEEGKEVYIGDNGVTYKYLCAEDIYSAYLNTMYGVSNDFYKNLTVSDISRSCLYYDEGSGNIYYFDGVLSTKTCKFERTFEDGYATCYVYSVTNEYDDGTTLTGEITLKIHYIDSVSGWYIVFDSASFEAK